MTISYLNDPSRRAVLAGSLAAALIAAVPALALSTDEARTLVQRVVDDINATINSGKGEAAMYRDFEQIFARYADVPTIAVTALGPEARSASPAQRRAFAEAFRGYIARKYGRRFRELIGGQVIVKDARQVKSYHEVSAIADLRGEPPFAVAFRVSDRSGRDLFFDILIEGVSLLRTEQVEIGAMLDRRRGDIDGLIADLRRTG